MALTRAQIARLMKAIDPNHVDKKRGLSYMAQHEVRAELTRIFGYGNWDSQVEEMTRLWEDTYEKDGKTYYRICYRAGIRLNVRDYWGKHICSFVEYHAEANSGLPDRGEAEAMAITSVESYALRRAALGLGDRLGLGLYNDGQITPLVRGSLQFTDPESPWFVEPEKGPSAPAVAGVAKLQAVVNAPRGAGDGGAE